MAIIPHLVTAADIVERVYKLIKRIQTDRIESRNKDVLAVQSDIDKLREIVELQMELLQKREAEMADLSARLSKLESRKRFLFW